jgi:putative peptidoglycan lipid II flippase
MSSSSESRTSESRGDVIRSAGILSATTMLSRILGVAREILFASIFGANWITDAFRVAYVIPYILRRLLGEGSMSAFIVPVFTEELEHGGREQVFRVAQTVYTLFFVLVSVVVVILVLLAPYLVLMIAPRFGAAPETLELATGLARLMLPYMLLMMLSAVSMGILNSFFKFFIPSLSPAVMNVCYISALGVIAYFYADAPNEHRIYILAIGVLAGGVGSVLLQIPSLLKEGLRFRLRFDFFTPAIRKIGLLMTPAMFSIGVIRLNLLVTTAAASFIGEGVISVINYAERLLQFPMGIFGYAISGAILPRLSRFAARGEHEELKRMLSFAIRLSLFISLPCTVGLILLAHPLVKLIYEHGQFTSYDTLLTGNILIGFSVFLVGMIGMQIITPVFYALKKPREPIAGAAVAFVANLIGTLVLVAPYIWYNSIAQVSGPLSLFGPPETVAALPFPWTVEYVGAGVAFASAMAATAAMVYLLIRFRKIVGPIGGKKILISALRYSGASAIMGVPVWLLNQFFVARFSDYGILAQIATIGITIALAVLVYAAAGYLLGGTEVADFVRTILRRNSRKKNSGG